MKDSLELHVGDQDDVTGGVSLLSPDSPNGMGITLENVRNLGGSCGTDDETMNQACIVVVPVDDIDGGEDDISKGLHLGVPHDGSTPGSSHMIEETGAEQTPDSDAPYDPVTQSWFTTKCSKDSLSEKGHKWKQGMWSRDEIELLEANIEEYVRDNKLTDASEVIFNNTKDNRKNFYRIVAQGLQRPLFAVYRRVIRMYDHKNHVGRYTAEDIKKLKELRAKHGNDWAFIGAEMGRSASSVKDKFRLLKDSCNRGKWSVEEETVLTDAIFTLSGVQPGESVTTGISWSQVAERVGTRTEKQCRAKWLNYMNWKQTGGSEWSRADDLILINRIGDTGAEVESEIDWEEMAKNWKSVRSPQWLRSKWWNLKRQFSGYESVDIKTLLDSLREMHSRRRLRDERSTVPVTSRDQLSTQLKNGTITVQVPIQLGNTHAGAESWQLCNMETSDATGLQSHILPQSALANLPATSTLFMSQGLTTVHADNHIIIQVANVQGGEEETEGSDVSARQIIITTRPHKQTVTSLGHDETDICASIQHSELSRDASAIVHSGDDLHVPTSSDHMTGSIGQSQVNVGEERPISSEAQLIGTDAVLPQQSVSNGDLVGSAETEATLVVVNTVPSSEELSQPTSGTVEDAQLGGGVFTLAGPLPVLQTQGDEHNLMGCPGHLHGLHHHEDEEQEEVRNHMTMEEEDEEEELETAEEAMLHQQVEIEPRAKARGRKRRRSQHR